MVLMTADLPVVAMYPSVMTTRVPQSKDAAVHSDFSQDIVTAMSQAGQHPDMLSFSPTQWCVPALLGVEKQRFLRIFSKFLNGVYYNHHLTATSLEWQPIMS